MARKGGNPGLKGVKGKSGRKSRLEEIKTVLENCTEEITQEALLKLANSRVFKAITENEGLLATKDFALPVTLRGMTLKIGGDKDNPLEVKIVNYADTLQLPAEELPDSPSKGN